jgi:hypothetical protein
MRPCAPTTAMRVPSARNSSAFDGTVSVRLAASGSDTCTKAPGSSAPSLLGSATSTCIIRVVVSMDPPCAPPGP